MNSMMVADRRSRGGRGREREAIEDDHRQRGIEDRRRQRGLSRSSGVAAEKPPRRGRRQISTTNRGEEDQSMDASYAKIGIGALFGTYCTPSSALWAGDASVHGLPIYESLFGSYTLFIRRLRSWNKTVQVPHIRRLGVVILLEYHFLSILSMSN